MVQRTYFSLVLWEINLWWCILASLKSSVIALLCRPDLTADPDLGTINALGEWINFCKLYQVVIPIAPAIWLLCRYLVSDMHLLTWKMSFCASLSMSSTSGLLSDGKFSKTGFINDPVLFHHLICRNTGLLSLLQEIALVHKVDHVC